MITRKVIFAQGLPQALNCVERKGNLFSFFLFLKLSIELKPSGVNNSLLICHYSSQLPVIPPFFFCCICAYPLLYLLVVLFFVSLRIWVFWFTWSPSIPGFARLDSAMLQSCISVFLKLFALNLVNIFNSWPSICCMWLYFVSVIIMVIILLSFT